MRRRDLVLENGLHLHSDLELIGIASRDEGVEDEMGKEVLRDGDVLEMQDWGEGAEDALDGRSFELRDEIVRPDADPVAVRVGRGVDRVDGLVRRRALPERERSAEEGTAGLKDRLGELIPSLASGGIDEVRGRGRGKDEVDCEAAEAQELLDGEGEELLMLGVVRRSVGADEEVLDEVKGEGDGLLVVLVVLEDDSWRLPWRDLEAIWVESAEDADARERRVPDLLVLGSVLERGAEEDLDEVADAPVERVSGCVRLELRCLAGHQHLELLERLEGDDVVLAPDPDEEEVGPLTERPRMANVLKPLVRPGELGDPAEVGDVLDKVGEAVGVVDDDVLKGLGGNRLLDCGELGPETDEARRRRADKGTDLVELERFDEALERMEGDAPEAFDFECALESRHDLRKE